MPRTISPPIILALAVLPALAQSSAAVHFKSVDLKTGLSPYSYVAVADIRQHRQRPAW